jgi:hypothetical protein
MFNYLRALMFGFLPSRVPGHLGDCYPVWLERNQVVLRLEGPGICGFFKSRPFGPEFHGILWTDGNVWSTEGVYGMFRGPDNTISKLHCGLCLGDDLECPECHGEGETCMTVRERANDAVA